MPLYQIHFVDEIDTVRENLLSTWFFVTYNIKLLIKHPHVKSKVFEWFPFYFKSNRKIFPLVISCLLRNSMGHFHNGHSYNFSPLMGIQINCNMWNCEHWIIYITESKNTHIVTVTNWKSPEQRTLLEIYMWYSNFMEWKCEGGELYVTRKKMNQRGYFIETWIGFHSLIYFVRI